jgi:PAS domain S-box-containing protein
LGGTLIWNLYTNRYRAEKLAEKMAKSLTDKDDTMKKLLDSSPGAIYTHSNEEKWSVTFVSDYFFRLTGYAPADYKTRKDFDAIIHPDDKDDARYEIQASITENEFYEVEYRIIKADQSIIWVMDKGYVERHKDKEFVRGVMVDITKTKRIERASHQLNNALMHMAEGISLVDRRGIFIEINPAFSTVTGWGMKDLPGVYFAETIHPEDQEEAEKLFDKLHRREKSSGELRALQPDGSCVYMSIIFVGLYDDGNELTGAYMFVRDISDRKTSEEKLRTAKEEISMAYKTKSDFLATMSHEIRSPLNVIIGYSDMLREELAKKAPELTEDIKAIQGAGAHLLDLVNDIIDISKLETGQTEISFHIFDVRDIVENVVSAVSSLITVNHNKLDVIIGANLNLMNSDFAKIRQNLINLISNAAKFTHKGHIELSIKASGSNHEWIQFSVTDTGHGIPKEKMERLFTPFATQSGKAHEEIKGTGLGLPIVKRYSELLGGHIEVHSEKGKGSSFQMILPRGDISIAENDRESTPLPPQAENQL